MTSCTLPPRISAGQAAWFIRQHPRIVEQACGKVILVDSVPALGNDARSCMIKCFEHPASAGPVVSCRPSDDRASRLLISANPLPGRCRASQDSTGWTCSTLNAMRTDSDGWHRSLCTAQEATSCSSNAAMRHLTSPQVEPAGSTTTSAVPDELPDRASATAERCWGECDRQSGCVGGVDGC